jgi:type VI secretion system protein ImpE
MQRAKDLLDAGHLAGAISELGEALRTRPADTALRMFLFEALCFQGDLVRARKQLDVLSTQADTPGFELTLEAYRGLLAAEAKRRDVFEGDGLPKFLLPPPPHVERYVVLLQKMRSAPGEVPSLLAEAEEASPAIAGERGGRRFAHLRDADDRVSGVLEVVYGSDYLWVPLTLVARLEVAPPRRLREMMWTQARLEIIGQPLGDVMLPALYAGSHRHANPQVSLGRMTEWESFADSMVLGSGQRVFLVDGEEVPLLELGTVSFGEASGGPAVAGASAT